MTSGKQARADRQAKIDAVTPKESKTRLIAGVLVAVLAVAAIAGAIWMGVRGSGDSAGTTPAGATGEAGGIIINADKTKANAATLDIYEDFQCPYCAQMHALYGPTVTKLANAGTLKVAYHMKNFLEKNMRGQGSTSSTRPANAAACAADAGKFSAYHDLVLKNQPETEGVGYADELLLQLGEKAGISGGALGTWTQCVKDGRYKGYVQRVDEASAKNGINSTPTYQVNGQTLELKQDTTPAQFEAMVLEAAKTPATGTPAPGASTPSVPN